MAARNAEYFGRYPEDRAAVTRIARHLRDTEEFLPDGERLTVERFQMVGSFLGGNTRVDALHHLLEDAFVGDARRGPPLGRVPRPGPRARVPLRQPACTR